MSNQKTIKKYEDKVQVSKANELRDLEKQGSKAIKKAQAETFKSSTLKIALIVGKACEWFESEGRTQMQLDGIKITRLNKEQSEIKGKEIFDKVEAKKAKKQDFVKMFFNYGRSQTFDFCKAYNINPITRRKFEREIVKETFNMPRTIAGLIKFANGIDSGKKSEQIQSEASDESESKKESKKAKIVFRDTANDVQYTEDANGKSKIKGDVIKSLESLLAKLKADQATETENFEVFRLNEEILLAGINA
tara:strand:+ start:602 stop:1348 length:747 start_codon:yes stop_codon:yes gene_type:complete